jgi:nitrate reductase NapE component
MLPGLCLCADSGVQHIMCSVFVFCCYFSLSSVPYVVGFVHRVQKTKQNQQQKTKTEHIMCWTPLSAHKHKADNIGYRRQRKITTKNENRTQYVFVFCCCFFPLSSVPYVTGFVFVCGEWCPTHNVFCFRFLLLIFSLSCVGHHYPHTNTKPAT